MLAMHCGKMYIAAHVLLDGCNKVNLCTEYIFCNGQNVRSCILNHIKNHNLIYFFIKFFHVDHIILAIITSSSGRFEIVISAIHTFCCVEIRASFPGVGCCLLCETIFERLK